MTKSQVFIPAPPSSLSLFVPTMIRESGLFLQISSNGIPHSLDSISIILGVQKPPWHRPMPARTLRFTPSSVRAPSGLRIASRISPSVTVSQRQMTCPYAGSF